MFQVRMKNLLQKMEDVELWHLKKDLHAEDSAMHDLIEEELRYRAQDHKKMCVACGNSLMGTNQFTLLFGPEGLKKRASFCGLDCLDQFTQKLREHKYGQQEKTTESKLEERSE